MDLTKFRTDAGAENAGVKITFGDATLIVGSLNSGLYKKVFQRKMIERRKRNLPEDEEDGNDWLIQCYAEAILLGWENIKDGTTPVPYSPITALEILRTCPAIREAVFAAANNNDNFLASRVEAAKAQMGESSTGS